MDGRDEHDPTARAPRERLVFVIDLTSPESGEARAAIHRAEGAADAGDAPPSPPTPIDTVALLVDGLEEPLLLEIEPTRDGKLLDALARLLKIAVLAGERVPSVAVEYGETYERTLAFEKRLPKWVYDGVGRGRAALLPEPVRRVLGPR